MVWSLRERDDGAGGGVSRPGVAEKDDGEPQSTGSASLHQQLLVLKV